jgi:uncharacterized protein YoxC
MDPEMRAAFAAMDRKFDVLTQSVNGQGARLDALTESVSGQGARLDALTESVNGWGEQLDGLSQTVKRLAGDVAALAAKVDAGFARVDHYFELQHEEHLKLVRRLDALT